jgi:3-phytase
MPNRQVRVSLLLVALNLGLAACGPASKSPEASTPENAVVPVVAETRPVVGAQPNDAAIWVHPSDASKSVVLGASGEGGLEVYDLDGKHLSALSDAQVDYVDVSPAFSLNGDPRTLIVGYDSKQGALDTFIVDPASKAVSRVSPRPLETGSEVTGLCTYHSPRTGRHYVFAATDDGFLQQWELFEKHGKVDGGLVRMLPFGVGVGYCAVDNRSGVVYVTEETVGIWKLAAEPESDPARELVDEVGARGQLAEEVKGVALIAGYLIAADVGAARINVYATSDAKYLGSFTLQGAAALDDAEGLAAGPADSIVVVAESYRLIDWNGIAGALKLESKTAPGSATPAQARNVMPTVETEPVDDYGDAADDPAIWVHPTDPAKSLIIAAQKKRGLYVYDLTGKTLQIVADGRMNNVDLRPGFKLGAGAVAIVAASNRTVHGLALYKIDPATRRLVDIAAGPIPTAFNDPYGLCMYRSAATGDFYVFMNDADSGAYKQWKLTARGDRVAAEVVREFTVGSQAEGCAADDETGALYIAEEDVGLWRYEAEPSGADRRVAIDDTTDKGHLTADVEGVAVYYGTDGSGYLIVSNQGEDNYAVYRREGRNEFVGHFSVIADPSRGIDGASETDGLDVIGTPLGAGFPHGLFIAQDGRNIAPAERQNFKLVPWERIAEVMSLHKRVN